MAKRLTEHMASGSNPSRTQDLALAWDCSVCNSLIEQLWEVRSAMLEYQRRLAPWLAQVDPAHQASAVNLAHYLALRRFDLRALQERLAAIGVSSLGRAEPHVLASLDKVLGILHRLAGRQWVPHTRDEPVGSQRGTALLQSHAQALFGTAPPERAVRIMVTLPSEAATAAALVDQLVQAGMDIARINCAHDGPRAWAAMAQHVRSASRSAARPVRILMDLAGPKIRTGSIASAGGALKLKPMRDRLGFVTQPLHLGVRAAGSGAQIRGASTTLEVKGDWVRQVKAGDVIKLTDSRLAKRRLAVLERQDSGLLLECQHTLYLTDGIELRLYRKGRARDVARLSAVPRPESRLYLQRGDLLRLVDKGLGHGARKGEGRSRASMARIACTVPEVLQHLNKGEHIWFDDGRIGGLVRRSAVAWAEVIITEAPEGGAFLAADKGINLPDSRLDLPALSAKDIKDLETVARCADIVGLSFAQSADDVEALRGHLHRLQADHVGLILKVETRRGFEQLPQLLFAAMGCSAAGVMIARGDLAVECGFERLAEVQEEILWACEAAHIPVVWATQVLESLAKTGLASRAEITDAAMGERAECVMLNKGPHILAAVRALDDILRRMQTHQSKKRPLLRALKAWLPSKWAAQSPPSRRLRRGSVARLSPRAPAATQRPPGERRS